MVYIYIYEEPLCLTRARGSSGKRSQPLKELLAKKYLVCVLLVPPPVVGTREIIANFISTHQIACWAMPWRRTALVVWRYKKIRGLNLTRSTWQIDRPAVIIYSRQMVYPQQISIYLMSNMIFFFFEKSFRIQSLRILFDVCFIVCMTF